MIILRNKIFSKRRDEESPKDANIMIKVGTVGLTTAGALGRAAKISAAAGGLLYLNGRALQEGTGMPTTPTKSR